MNIEENYGDLIGEETEYSTFNIKENHGKRVGIGAYKSTFNIKENIGKQVGIEKPGTYTAAQDYKDMEHPTHFAMTGGAVTQRAEKSRLVSHLSAFFNPIEDKFDEKLILSKRKTIGQSGLF